MRVGVITCIPGMVLLYSACAGDFNPNLHQRDESSGEDDDTFETPDTSADDSGDSTTSSEEDDTGEGPGTSATMTTHSDPSSSDGDEVSTDGESSGNDTDPLPPGCGNEQIENSEECDGENLNGHDCESVVGALSGQLGCFENCTFDVSGCSLGGSQPDDGLWSACSDYPDCESDPPDGIIWFCENFMCSFDCDTVADCGPSPGGTAVSECRDLGNDLHRCYLNCDDGKTCPAGMTCAGSYCRTI